jgi:hypothetical protein
VDGVGRGKAPVARHDVGDQLGARVGQQPAGDLVERRPGKSAQPRRIRQRDTELRQRALPAAADRRQRIDQAAVEVEQQRGAQGFGLIVGNVRA